MDLGVIEKKEFENRVYEMNISPEEIRYYVDGDWVVRRWTDKSGNKRETRLFETLLSGDVWDLFDNGGYDGDWQAALDYYVDNENEQKIKDIVMKIAQNKNCDYEDMSLEELIKDVDDNYDVRNALSSSMHDAEIDSYYNYYIKTLRDALSEYGEVLRLNDEGALIKIDLVAAFSEPDKKKRSGLINLAKEKSLALYTDSEEFSTMDVESNVCDAANVVSGKSFTSVGESTTANTR